ncbi:MAG: metallophosphoesterase family protein [Pseudomonadota bacterium]
MSSIDFAAFSALSPAHLQWLKNMPATAQLSPDVFACHGTPNDDLTYWLEAVSPEGEITLRPRAEIEAETNGITATLFLCGHTHLPRRVDLHGGRVILNPGSVGCPGYMDDIPVDHIVQSGTPAACYAIVEQTERGWVTSFRHIPYDPTRMMERAIAANHPQWADRIASGWVTT